MWSWYVFNKRDNSDDSGNGCSGLGLENLALLVFLLRGLNRLLVSGLDADFTDASTGSLPEMYYDYPVK